MRRNFSLLLGVLALLAFGGLAVTNKLDAVQLLFKGTYIPNVSFELSKGVPAALVLMGGTLGVLAVVFGMAVALGVGAQRATQMEAAFKAKDAAKAGEAKAAPAAKPAPAAKGDEPSVPLSATRSLIIFWIAISALVLAFMAIRFYGEVGKVYMPNPGAELFKIPGAPVKNLPKFIPGPGGMLTAGWAFPAIMLGSLVAAAAVGVGLARLFAVLDAQVKTAAQMPRNALDKLIADVDSGVQNLFKPKAPRPPGNLFDQALIGLDLVLVLIIAAIVVIWVVPAFGGVQAVDNAVKATQIAALWTPTPLPGPTPTPGPSPDDEFATLPVGDAASGEALTAQFACLACHVTVPENGQPMPGVPWMSSASADGLNVAARAQTRWQGADYHGRAASAEGYLLESIKDPNAYVVTGYQPNIMPAIFGKQLTPNLLADVIAYLLTVKLGRCMKRPYRV